MESLDHWRLSDEFSVIEAALLIIGCDPSGPNADVESWKVQERPHGYQASMSALKHAILSGRLPATIRRSAWEKGWDEEPGDGEEYTKKLDIFNRDLAFDGSEDPVGQSRWRNVKSRGVIYRAQPDWSLTTIHLDALKEWLSSRGFKTGFFFPKSTNAPDFLDPNNPRYAAKLAASVKAWQAVTDVTGKHPKQALIKWLREHAAEFDLSDDEGKPNETGIDECAKVANWQPGGGAPKTPL